MCQFPQYIIRRDVYSLFRRGFDTLLIGFNQQSISIYNFYKTREGFKYKLPKSNINYYESIDHSHVCKTRDERKDNLKYYAHYNEDPEKFQLFNSITAEIIPLYHCVPCGNCLICQNRKTTRISTRALLESASTGVPFFITLTLNPEHLQKYIDAETKEDLKQLQVDEIQRFLKRLRKHLEIYESCKIKYIFVSEFGKENTCRLHYHGLIWCTHLSLSNLVDYHEIHNGKHCYFKGPRLLQYIKKAWQLGIVECELAKDNKGSYVMKYIHKDLPTIRLQSKKIGYETIDQYRDFIYNNPDITKFQILNPHTNEYLDIPICNFISRYVYPSFARSVPVRLRRLLDIYFHTCYEWRSFDYFQRRYDEMYERVKLFDLDNPFDYANSYTIKSVDLDYKYAGSLINAENRLKKIEKQILPYFQRLDLERIKESDNKHKEHLNIVATTFDKDYTRQLEQILKNKMKLKEKERI